MNWGNKIINAAGILALAGAAWLLWQRQQTVGNLREENVTLQQQTAQAEPLAAEHDRLTKLLAQAVDGPLPANEQLVELARLRREAKSRHEKIATLRTSTSRQVDVSATTPVLTIDGVPISLSQPAGYSTPQSTFQSLASAMSRGDVKEILAACTPEQAVKLQAEWKDMSEEQVKEELMAIFARQGNPSLQILNTKSIADDQKQLTVFGGTDDEPSIVKFKQIDGAWKIDRLGGGSSR